MKAKIQDTNLKKILEIYTANKRLVSKVYKVLLQIRKTSTQHKNGQKP